MFQLLLLQDQGIIFAVETICLTFPTLLELLQREQRMEKRFYSESYLLKLNSSSV